MRLASILYLAAMISLPAMAAESTSDQAAEPAELTEARTGRTCKEVSSCEEAVALWCNGYKRADADKDGIPCENVCSTKDQVDAIRASIGC